MARPDERIRALRSAFGFELLHPRRETAELRGRQRLLDQREQDPLLVTDVALEAQAELT